MSEQDLKINALEIHYKVMEDKIDKLSGLVVSEFSQLRKEMKGDRTELKNNYVSKTEFNIVRSIVYGLVAIILTTVIGYLVKSILI